ncbi:MAG: hypothetical protein RL490_37 [Pseudomonadota bacterium]|jgi:hypothetical protein
MFAHKRAGRIVVITFFCAMAYIGLSGAPRLPIGLANGTYSNPCCGLIALKNGMMTAGSQRIGYVIEKDKVGATILPETYVEASQNGLVFRSDFYPLYIRLDNSDRPRQVEIAGGNGEVYPFVRVDGS